MTDRLDGQFDETRPRAGSTAVRRVQLAAVRRVQFATVVNFTASRMVNVGAEPGDVALSPVGNGPNEIAITPDGTRAYVATLGAGTVEVISTATNTKVESIKVADHIRGRGQPRRRQGVRHRLDRHHPRHSGARPVRRIVNRNRHGWLCGQRRGAGSMPGNTGSITVIDTATGTVTNQIAGSSRQYGLALSPNGTKLYVVNYDAGTMTIYG